MRYFLTMAAIGAVALTGLASTSAPVHSQTPSASPPGAAAPDAAGSKRAACKAAALSLQGDRQGKIDQYELCLVQARMDCLKEAIARKVTGSDRRDYLKKCVGSRDDDNKI